jgi:ankyrin repeat protein
MDHRDIYVHFGEEPMRGSRRNGIVDHASQGNLYAVQAILSQGGDVNRDGGAALACAAYQGNVCLTLLLLNWDVEVNPTNALEMAIEKGRSEIVDLLIEANADVNRKRDDGTTLLMIAASRGNPTIVRALIQAGADIAAKDKNDKTALMFAAEQRHGEIVADIFLGECLDEEAMNKMGSPLLWSMRKGYIDVFISLLLYNTSVNERDRYDKTALTFAAEEGRAEFVKVLLEHGADVNAVDRHNQTALLCAIKPKRYLPKEVERYVNTVTALLSSKEIDIHIADKNGDTPLKVATKFNLASIVNALNKFEQDKQKVLKQRSEDQNNKTSTIGDKSGTFEQWLNGLAGTNIDEKLSGIFGKRKNI